jgi:hypothetical protein
MMPAAIAPPRAEAGCGESVTASASAATAAIVIDFNMFYPFKVAC